MPLAARVGDLHNCPLSTGPTPHVGGPVLPGGEPTVLIGGMPAARAGDQATCTGPPDVIVRGSASVLIGGLPAARQGDTTAHGGVVALGCPTVLIGDGTASGGSSGSGQETVGPGLHWVEIQLLGEADRPLVGEPYVVELPDGRETRGHLNEEGRTRVEGLEQPGTCRVRFPRRDATLWGPAPSTSAPEFGEDAPSDDADELQPVSRGEDDSGEWVEVGRGEDLFRIAARIGREWRALWDHPHNADLRRRRGRPGLLWPGDQVFIPNREDRVEEIATDQAHEFRLIEGQVPLRLQLKSQGRPLRNQPYRLFVDDDVLSGDLDGEGVLDTRVPAHVDAARLVVGRGLGRRVFRLELGGLDPVNSVRGVQQRLANLGYRCPQSGDLCDDTRRAIRNFQRNQDLRVKSWADQPTRQRLRELHGS